MSSAQLKKLSQVKPADIEWRNGLPFSREFKDVYYSDSGAVQESEHVFLKGCDLTSDWSNPDQNTFKVLELGFGSGLNFLNTAQLWQQTFNKNFNIESLACDATSNISNTSNIDAKNNSNKNNKLDGKHLHYISIEMRPFSLQDFIKTSQIWPQFKHITTALIRQYPSTTYGRHQILFKQFNITLTLIFMPAEDALQDLLNESKMQQHKTNIDHFFLDGFAPSKNSSMWAEQLMLDMADLAKVGSKLATYSVAASVKRPIAAAGFKLIKRKGFGRKREMLTAIFESQPAPIMLSETINIKYESPWFNLTRSPTDKRVAIIGGGIAGTTTALALSQKGYQVDLFESQSALATQASGAAAGIFHPQLTSDMNINSQFNWLAYLACLNFLSSLTESEKAHVILTKGVCRLLKSAQLKQQLLTLSKQLKLEHWIKGASLFVDNNRAIDFPHAAAINMNQLCHLLWNKIPQQNKTLWLNSEVSQLKYINQHWQFVTADNQQHRYQQVVFCGGAKSPLLNHLVPITNNISRGQTCILDITDLPEMSQKLKQTISEKAYLVPKSPNQWHLGASFDDFIDDELNPNNQQLILKDIATLLTELKLPFYDQKHIAQLPLTGTVGYRLHTPDHLPLVGPAIDKKKLTEDFSSLGQTKLKRQRVSQYNLKGLWLNTAYGSHGLLYSFLASQHLASLLDNDVSPIETKLSQALHPARFFIRQLKNTKN